MNFTLRIWRQQDQKSPGRIVTYQARNVSPDSSFLEMLDVLNEELQQKGEAPVAFDSDCREGICGTCSMMVNGVAHGPEKGTTICQTHMRVFTDNTEITIEPWRAEPFPIIRDLVVDRSAFDKIIAAGGFVSVNTGNAPDGNALPIGKEVADLAMDAAACIGCGACVAACKNASASLFVSAKVSHLNLLPQGEPEKYARVVNMIDKMDELGFGACSFTQSCEAVCPKEISTQFIARMNWDYSVAVLKGRA